MFAVDDATAAAIRSALTQGGELSGIGELRRHLPMITDNEKARLCVRMIAGWKPLPVKLPRAREPEQAKRRIVGVF